MENTAIATIVAKAAAVWAGQRAKRSVRNEAKIAIVTTLRDPKISVSLAIMALGKWLPCNGVS
jgi:predicted transcriptional regulator